MLLAKLGDVNDNMKSQYPNLVSMAGVPILIVGPTDNPKERRGDVKCYTYIVKTILMKDGEYVFGRTFTGVPSRHIRGLTGAEVGAYIRRHEHLKTMARKYRKGTTLNTLVAVTRAALLVLSPDCVASQEPLTTWKPEPAPDNGTIWWLWAFLTVMALIFVGVAAYNAGRQKQAGAKDSRTTTTQTDVQADIMVVTRYGTHLHSRSNCPGLGNAGVKVEITHCSRCW